jgi:hypothetical protein
MREMNEKRNRSEEVENDWGGNGRRGIEEKERI